MICSGQAIVLHRLALASKDGDWILREEPEALAHVLAVLAERGARYRFGAPLDVAWLKGGWSAHFEFPSDGVRVRTGFLTRPPRVEPAELARMWRELEQADPPFTDARILARMKQTNRQKDYPIIGELARRMTDPADQLSFSRSADDLLALAQRHPDLVRRLAAERPVLSRIAAGRRALAEALQLEMLDLIELNERRLARYLAAGREWAAAWPGLNRELERLPLPAAHARLVERARQLLPVQVLP